MGQKKLSGYGTVAGMAIFRFMQVPVVRHMFGRLFSHHTKYLCPVMCRHICDLVRCVLVGERKRERERERERGEEKTHRERERER